MRIYNSLTDKVEEFKPINEGKVTMYVCGPTVYNYVHIGNMRPVITFDMVYKYLKYLGYDVKYASNYTDINPKITKAAEALGITERANISLAEYKRLGYRKTLYHILTKDIITFLFSNRFIMPIQISNKRINKDNNKICK